MIGFLGIILAFLFPASKYILLASFLIIILAWNKFEKIKYQTIIFLILFLMTSFSMNRNIELPNEISATGLVLDDFASDEAKYIVKIGSGVNVLLYSKENLKIGDRINFTGKVNKPIGKMNFTDFDYKSYLMSKNIYGSVYSNGEKDLEQNKLLGLRELFKSHVSTSFKNLSSSNSEFLSSVLLSDSSYLEESNLKLYRSLGISHLLALSGFHIYLIFTFLEYGLKFCKVPKISRRIFIIAITFIYIWLIGLPVAALRAFIMSSCQFISFLSKQKYSPFKSLELSVIIILLLNPYNLTSVSFWLSVMAVIGVITLYKRYNYLFKGNILKEGFGLSLCVLIMIIPITAYFFYEINLMSLISNVILVPFYSIAIIMGFIIAFTPFGFIVEPATEILLNLMSFISGKINLPLSLDVAKPSIVFICLYYCIIYAYTNNLRFKKYKTNQFVFLSLIIILLLNGITMFKEYNTLKITSIYVGQGDSTLISYKGRNYLIDTGGSRVGARPGKIYTLNYLKGRGINKIDKLFISHFDEDHVDGVLDLIGKIEIKETYLPYMADNQYTKELQKVSKVYEFSKGSKITTKDIKIESLNSYSEHREENENSLLLLLTFKDFKALFTGDGNVNKLNKKVDYLKVSHHGSRNSTNLEFLESIRPDHATISSGVNNSYGHPHKEVIEMLDSLNVNHKTTSNVGEINFKFNKEFKGYLERENYNLILLIFLLEFIVLILFINKNKSLLEEKNELSRHI